MNNFKVTQHVTTQSADALKHRNAIIQTPQNMYKRFDSLSVPTCQLH